MGERKRVPKRFQGIEKTSKHIADLLPGFLENVSKKMQMRPDEVLAAWPQLVGEKLATMAKAVSFNEGILTVKVSNSTLYSLLSSQEKARLLSKLRGMFPSIPIHNIQFRVG